MLNRDEQFPVTEDDAMSQENALRDRMDELAAKVKRLESYVHSYGGAAILGAVGVLFLWAGH